MSDIQTQAQGLFSFLSLKGSPGPRALVEQVMPTLDLGAFYRAGRLITSSNTSAAVSAVGQGATVTIPAGENWLVCGVMGALGSPLAIGTIMAAHLNVVAPGQNSFAVAELPASGASYTAAAVTDEVSQGFFFPQPQLFTPGTSFTCFLSRPCGGANTVVATARVLYVPLGV